MTSVSLCAFAQIYLDIKCHRSNLFLNCNYYGSSRARGFIYFKCECCPVIRSKSIFLFFHFDFVCLLNWSCFAGLILFSIENHFDMYPIYMGKRILFLFNKHLHIIYIWMIGFLSVFLNILIWWEFRLLYWFILLLL